MIDRFKLRLISVLGIVLDDLSEHRQLFRANDGVLEDDLMDSLNLILENVKRVVNSLDMPCNKNAVYPEIKKTIKEVNNVAVELRRKDPKLVECSIVSEEEFKRIGEDAAKLIQEVKDTYFRSLYALEYIKWGKLDKTIEKYNLKTDLKNIFYMFNQYSKFFKKEILFF